MSRLHDCILSCRPLRHPWLFAVWGHPVIPFAKASPCFICVAPPSSSIMSLHTYTIQVLSLHLSSLLFFPIMSFLSSCSSFRVFCCCIAECFHVFIFYLVLRCVRYLRVLDHNNVWCEFWSWPCWLFNERAMGNNVDALRWLVLVSSFLRVWAVLCAWFIDIMASVFFCFL